MQRHTHQSIIIAQVIIYPLNIENAILFVGVHGIKVHVEVLRYPHSRTETNIKFSIQIV